MPRSADRRRGVAYIDDYALLLWVVLLAIPFLLLLRCERPKRVTRATAVN